MSAVGTQLTKGERMAAEMAQQLGGVVVRAGSGGLTMVTKAEAERRKLIDKAKADLAETDKAALDQIFDKPVQAGVKKRATSGKRELAKMATTAQQVAEATPVAEVVEVPAAPVKEK